DGRFIRFDNPSNTRVVEIVRNNKSFDRYIAERAPLQVSVIGTTQGDVAVVDSLNPQVAVAPPGQPNQPASGLVFDARYNGDRGKLVLGEWGMRFEDISNASHSRMWNYAQIKELKREGSNELKIQPYSGDSMEIHLDGPGLSDAVYQTVADRIVA